VTDARASLPRRRFLGLACGALVCGCSSSAGPAQFGDLSAGNVSALPVGSLRALASAPACIGRDSSGVYAMTLTCTHAGCDMGESGSVSPQGLVCACHGSEFDADGNVVRGPATQDLEHFAVSADASGNLTVHGGQTVSASTRLTI
jgi:Rieske Fe-S protein